VPYEELVAQAAHGTRLGDTHVRALEDAWLHLPVWSGAQQALTALSQRYLLGVVTNCSTRLGHLAAQRLRVPWDCVVTAEEAGFYKPHPAPYQQALRALNVSAAQTLFVAGSGYDLFGTAALGLKTFWHNRAGLELPPDAPAPDREERDLSRLVSWVDAQFQLTQSGA
jgi:2-haloacid dehalogenase